MGIFDKCLLVSDVDGTLHHDGKIVSENLEKIEYFIKNGGTFTLATGRAPQATTEVFREAKCNAPLVAFNGRGIFDYKTNKSHFEYSFSNEDKKAFIEFAEQFPDVGVMMQNSDKIFTLHESPLQKWYVEYEALDEIVTDFESIIDENWIKTIFITDDQKKYSELENKAKNVSLNGCSFLKTSVQYFECLRSDTDKWTGVLNLKKLLGNDYKVFTIGDYYNDLEMIKGADLGAATGNAPDEVKQVADTVTCSCVDGAVADFIDKIEIYIRELKK